VLHLLVDGCMMLLKIFCLKKAKIHFCHSQYSYEKWIWMIYMVFWGVWEQTMMNKRQFQKSISIKLIFKRENRICSNSVKCFVYSAKSPHYIYFNCMTWQNAWFRLDVIVKLCYTNRANPLNSFSKEKLGYACHPIPAVYFAKSPSTLKVRHGKMIDFYWMSM
jgi:hypothetical protein